MAALEATRDFFSAMDEVHELLRVAGDSDENFQLHNALLKSSILLLTAKFECFVEDAAEEVKYRLELDGVGADRLPVRLRVACVQNVIDDSFIAKVRHGSEKALSELKVLIPLLAGDRVNSVPIDTRFSYGKHGSVELEKLMVRLGISKAFEIFDGMAERQGAERGALKAAFDSLTAIRNNIIHTDATPSFTVDQVKEYEATIVVLTQAIDECLAEHCDAICRAHP